MKKLSYILPVIIIYLAGCEKNQPDYIAGHKKDLLSVTASAGSAEADGKSIITLVAKINNRANINTVNFLTNTGSFLDSNRSYTTKAVLSNDSLLAKAYLITAQEESNFVNVKVSIAGLDTILSLKFTTAFADSINVESTVASITNTFGSNFPVSVYLMRKTGKPSIRQTVSLKAIRENNNPIGEFYGISLDGSDINGTVKSTFILKDTVYTGKLRIIATYQSNTKTLTDTLLTFVTQH